MAEEVDRLDRQGFARLDGQVARLLAEHQTLRERFARLEVRASGLEGLLSSFESGETDPEAMKARLDVLEQENRDMARRLDEGRDGVERLLARIRFIEEQR